MNPKKKGVAKCLPCKSSVLGKCRTCDSQKTCTSCYDQYFLQFDAKVGVTSCVKMCGQGFRKKNYNHEVGMFRESNYADMSDIRDIPIVIKSNSCEKCKEENCTRCNINKNACIECGSVYVLLDGKCLSMCPATHGQNLVYDAVLNFEVKTCITCESMGLEHCTKCKNSTTCTECSKGLFLRTDPKTKQTECAAECGDYFWQREVALIIDPSTVDPNAPAFVTASGKQIVCEPCMEFCLKCSSDYWCDKCDFIDNTWYIAKNSSQVKNKCKVRCPEQGYFDT